MIRLATAALTLATLAAPVLGAAPQDGAPSRIEVIQGRAIVLGGGADAATVRRSESIERQGRAQVELAAGSQARIGWGATCSMHVWGPASIEWGGPASSMQILVRELAWADVEARSGHHEIALPSDWFAGFGRGAFHLRGLSGGPVEVRHHAGTPVTVDWRGDRAMILPPVTVYPGSSVRLDRPRHVPSAGNPTAYARPWAAGNEVAEHSAWPWRARTDTPAQAEERKILAGETQRLNEVPGQPGGTFGGVRAYESDGSSTVQTFGAPGREVTYAQVPVRPGELGFEIHPRTAAPAAPETQAGTAPITFKPFVADQWRGIGRKQLNGAGAVAAEVASGVEVRMLGGGRVKVFVSTGAPGPRWCFAPGSDYLMHPGAVAVFEADGTLRMSFGRCDEQEALAGRPQFDRLEK